MADILQQVMNALSAGATYALLALGLAMVFNILGLINFAHGQLLMIAAYTMYFLQMLGLPFPIQVMGAIAAGGLAAALVERLVFRPLRGASFPTFLLASFAVSAAIQGGITIVAGPLSLGVATPALLSDGFSVGGVKISSLQVITIATCGLLLLVLSVFLKRSPSGLAMRAAAEDFPVTRLMGISANRVIALAFVISGLAAGVASVLIVAGRGAIDPQMGFNPLLVSFIATVIGGLGSLGGAVLGGFVLGAIETVLGAVLSNSFVPFAEAFTLLIVIVILYLRPQGILGRHGEEV